jgi:NAD(P)-dependent dehydrogenase (short-subunit alcohol dehydrogenase family)
MDLRDRVAVVSGGASGIGAAVVDRLTALGARPVVWDLNSKAEVVCDVADPLSVDAALRRTREIAGAPTLVAACAGVGHSGLLTEVTPEAWDRVMGINLKGAWLTMSSVARGMRDARLEGAMVAVTSVSARLVDRGMGAYCASKAALDMLVKVAAYEWAEHGIRVNGIGPGVTRTPMLGRAPDTGMADEVVERTPLHRLGEAEDIAQALVLLLTLDWVTGQILLADGGLSLYSPIDFYGAAERKAQREGKRNGRG